MSLKDVKGWKCLECNVEGYGGMDMMQHARHSKCVDDDDVPRIISVNKESHD
mgnify:CR=1 FL=1